MKKIFVYAISSALMAGTVLSSCTYSGYESYIGTMAGAEIGGIIGESIGWMNTSRHSGPGNAMLTRKEFELGIENLQELFSIT